MSLSKLLRLAVLLRAVRALGAEPAHRLLAALAGHISERVGKPLPFQELTQELSQGEAAAADIAAHRATSEDRRRARCKSSAGGLVCG
jgi:hypothetical protein